MASRDRTLGAELIVLVGNFRETETDCALEPIDRYRNDKNQADYHVVVVEDSSSAGQGYACWGPVPLTRGTYDLYWIATRPESQGRGSGGLLCPESKII
jgi:hypothetical protein